MKIKYSVKDIPNFSKIEFGDKRIQPGVWIISLDRIGSDSHYLDQISIVDGFNSSTPTLQWKGKVGTEAAWYIDKIFIVKESIALSLYNKHGQIISKDSPLLTTYGFKR